MQSAICVAKPAAGEDLQRTVGVSPKDDEEVQPGEIMADVPLSFFYAAGLKKQLISMGVPKAEVLYVT